MSQQETIPVACAPPASVATIRYSTRDRALSEQVWTGPQGWPPDVSSRGVGYLRVGYIQVG